MKVFISQPMNGKTLEEIESDRADIIKRIAPFLGEFEVIDSVFKDYEPKNGNIALKYLSKSLELLADADLVVFGEGWEDARGCRIEHACAEEYGIRFL